MLEDGRRSDCDHAEVVAGRYRLGPVLSGSAGSCAHRAYDELLQRTVRVTLVDAGPTEAESFSVRPQGWHDRDPEVAELFDAGTDDGRFFLVTHHPDEPTLAETTPPGGLDLGQLRDLGTAVATALVPRHERGAAHGALGAGTVAFTPQGASLTEFGLLPWLARWGDVPVTPPYAPPEQRTGAASGPASDVYALGRLLTELAPPDGLRPDLQSLLADMTAAAPADRPSMAEVQRRLAGRRSAATYGRRIGLVAVACCLVGLIVGLSAFAGEMPAVGSSGATLSATAAVPSPVLPLAPLPPVTAEVAHDVVSHDAASRHTASAATATQRSTPSRGDDSPRVVEAAQRSSTTSHHRSGSTSDSDSADRPSRTTSPTPDRDSDATPAPTRTSPTPKHRPGSTPGSGHHSGGVVTQVGSSLGGHPQSGADKDGDDASSADHGDSGKKGGTLLDADLLASVTDSS